MSQVVHTYSFGHPIYYDGITWRIRETDEDYWDKEVAANMVCPECDEKPSKEGHDPCCANLPNVAYACCGHGILNGDMNHPLSQPYIEFEDGTVVRFDTTGQFHRYIKEHLGYSK